MHVFVLVHIWDLNANATARRRRRRRWRLICVDRLRGILARIGSNHECRASIGLCVVMLLVVVNLGGWAGIPWWKIVRHQVVALQLVHMKGQHPSSLLHEALVRYLVSMHGATQHIVAKAHKSVTRWVPISAIPWHG